MEGRIALQAVGVRNLAGNVTLRPEDEIFERI